MLKLNYLDSPKLLYRMGIRFYEIKILKNEHEVLGMQISLTNPLTREQRYFLYAIDTFYEISPTTIMFKTFAQYKRESQSPDTFDN